MFRLDHIVKLVQDLADVLKDAGIDVNKKFPGIAPTDPQYLDKYLKKEMMVVAGREFYDKWIDQVTVQNPNGKLPGIIDFGIKYALIPFIADAAIAELKSLGIIPSNPN